MTWHELFDPVFSGRVCVTLLHSLWQVAALAAVAWLIERSWHKSSVERSYVLHVSVLSVALVAMPVTYFSIDVSGNSGGRLGELTSDDRVASMDAARFVSDAEMSAVSSADSPDRRDVGAATSVPDVALERTGVGVQSVAVPSASFRQRAVTWSVAAYAVGVLLMFARLVLAIGKANRLSRQSVKMAEGPLVETVRTLAEEWSMKVVPALATARQIAVPHVVGLLRPTILLPASAVSGMSTADLELILIHELAHVRRHDMWVNLLQRLGETFLFFNPSLWLLSRRISALREYCCDDIACRTQPDAEPQLRYATALLRIVELSTPRTTADLAALAATGRSPSELRRRVARLFGESVAEPLRLSRSGIRVIVGALVLIACGPMFWPEQQHGAAANQAATDADADADKKPAASKPVTEKESSRQFRLLVTGPDDTPVANASVEIRARPGLSKEQVRQGAFEKKHRYGLMFRTDQNGRLTIDLPKKPSSFRVSIMQPGYGPAWVGWASDTHPENVPETVTVKLDAGWSVGGIVVDGEGQPVEGAQVSPSLQFKKQPGDMHRLGIGTRLSTDKEGKWRFDSVPVSKDAVFVSINHSGYQALRTRLQREQFELKDDSVPSAQITLDSGLSVTGVITDEAGTPLEGVRLRTKFVNEIRETETDAQGKYRLTGCEPRKARIVASAKGYATDMQEVRVDSDLPLVNFTMKRGRTIRVRVVDEEGQGISKARIFFQRWRTWPFQYFEFDHVSQYTDENGVWEWHEAPIDEFSADICRPGGMRLMYQSLIAREEEYVFSPPKALVISGRVIDAVTKKPVTKFRAVPGTHNEPRQKSGDNWQRNDSYLATDGTYRITRTDVAPAHMIRIEADGYQVATSRRISSDEGAITVDFELMPAKDIAVQLIDKAGQPAAGARIALGVAGSQISLLRGDIRDVSTFATQLAADAQGRFRIPARDDPFQLVITHAAGFAHVKSADGAIPDRVQLTPWARVEATFKIGANPAPAVALSLFNRGGPRSYDPGMPGISIRNEVRTGKDGRFVFERVFPGTGRIGRNITFMGNEGATEATSSNRIPAKFISGETTKLDLGGTGRPIVGQLIPPDGYSKRVDWKQASSSCPILRL